MEARPFSVRGDRVWRLPSGVGVRVDAVLRDGETLLQEDAAAVVGPAALVHAARADEVLLQRWVAAGERIELGSEAYVLRRVDNVGTIAAVSTNAEFFLTPLPRFQPGRAATFAPA